MMYTIQLRARPDIKDGDMAQMRNEDERTLSALLEQDREMVMAQLQKGRTPDEAQAALEKETERLISQLELKDTILEMADDLCFGCLMEADSEYKDEVWLDKYVRSIRRP